jgi:hypothetical protein
MAALLDGDKDTAKLILQALAELALSPDYFCNEVAKVCSTIKY